MKKKKVSGKLINVLLILSIIILGAVLMGSYAYIRANVFKDEAKSFSLDVQTEYLDNLYYTNSGDIILILNSDTFGAGADNSVNNISTSISSRNISDSDYLVKYNGYLTLENEFVYSVEGTPEIILSIENDSGEEITEIEGLEYIEESGVKGFDITNKEGVIEIFTERELSVVTVNTETWYFTFTIIAHTFDQSINQGANFNASIYITDETYYE